MKLKDFIFPIALLTAILGFLGMLFSAALWVIGNPDAGQIGQISSIMWCGGIIAGAITIDE